MKYFKVINFLKPDGNADYKGLEIDQFVAMTQQYDFKNGLCVIGTNQIDNLPNNDDLIELTELEYLTLSEEIKSKYNNVSPLSEIDMLKNLFADIIEVVLMGV